MVGKIICYLFLGLMVYGLIGMIIATNGGALIFFGVLIGAPLALVKLLDLISPPKDYEEEEKKKRKTFSEYEQEHGVGEKTKVVGYFKGVEKIDIKLKEKGFSPSIHLLDSILFYIWKEENKLRLVSSPHWLLSEPDKLYFFGDFIETGEIDIDNINYYSLQGEKYTTTELNGGGSSLGKAVVGGAIAGSAGAVIASRKEVTSSTKVVDERQTIINYQNENGVTHIILSSNAYDFLLEILPDKDYNYVMSQKETKENNQPTSLIELEQLADLRDKGILTEEEFTAKKKQILGL